MKKMSRLIQKCFKIVTAQSGNVNNAVPAVTAVGKNNYGTTAEANFDVQPFKLHKLDEGPKMNVTLKAEDAALMYRQMVLIRRLEAAAGALYQEKNIRGFCHLYTGQEAIAVGMKAAMRDVDTLITSYRAHGWTYLMGVNSVGVLSELTGKKTGCARGKGGSMHMYAKNFYGGNGIVGAQVPLGVGLAFESLYNNTGGVNFALYGDGAANQGQIFEVYNMAKLLNIPCVFVCENNGYGMGTSVKRAAASPNYYTRGDFVPGIWVDGMDVLTAREATRFVIEHCTSGKGPIVMEMATYRYVGHSMSDPGTSYRTREEIQEVRQTKDAISHFKDKIVSAGLVTADEIKKMDADVKKEVELATDAARKDPEIDVSEMATDIYANCLEPQVRSVLPNQYYTHRNLFTPQNIK